MAFKIIPIAVSAFAVAGVTMLTDKFIFKRETDPRQAIINAVVVAVVLGVAGMVTKKTVGGTGLAEIPSKIAQK
jgi:hypothetical protein